MSDDRAARRRQEREDRKASQGKPGLAKARHGEAGRGEAGRDMAGHGAPLPADRKGQWAKEQEEREIERDWELDPEWNAYVTHVRQDLVPKIMDSGMTISIVPKGPEDVDVKFAIELGMSIMFDKPLILCLPHEDTVLPEHLRRVADHIVYGSPTDEGAREALMAAINAVGETLGGDE